MIQIRKHCFWKLRLANSLVIVGALTLGNGFSPIAFYFPNYAFAQSAITPDNTLGTESSEVINNYLDNPTEQVIGGATRGTNLFHSFLEFNVSRGRTALFSIPNSNIQNVLVRVTGNNRSEILGRLQISDSNANLFLINPNGIFFGPNARLQLNGSFVASTADSIKFADNTVFSATASQTTPLLTVSVPLGLHFGGTAGDINVQGFLRVQPGKTLALVGGNLNLDNAYLQAPSGQIALGGLLGEGTIGLNFDSNQKPLSIPKNVVLGDISLSNQAEVNVSDDEGSGYIQLQGRRITLMDQSYLVATVSDVETQNSQYERGIFIQAQQLSIQDGSQATVSTYSPISGGSLVVEATDSVQVTGTDAEGNPSALFADTYEQGAAGSLTIETGKLIVENGGNITASARENSQGTGGTLKVTASNLVQLSGISTITGKPSGLFAETEGSGNAGSLEIDTRELIVQNGAQIVAGTGENSQGNGGSLSIHSTDFVELSGVAPNGQYTSGLFARSRGSGDAGSVYINTGKLIVRDNAQVTVTALEGGNAGNLDIKAREIFLDTKGQLFATTTSGDGGNINLQIENLLLLRNNSQIATDASGGGNAGNITITIPDGSIVAVSEENSDISADADTGSGGRVNIDAFRVFGIQPREQRTDLSDITATSESGPQGNIEIKTSDIEPRPEVINLLPNQPVEPKVSQVCQAGTARNNSFTIAGRGGLPANPTETLNSDAILTDWITLDQVGEFSSGVTRKKNFTHPSQASIVEATGWVINAKGEVVLTANAPDTLHNSWQKSTDCSLPE